MERKSDRHQIKGPGGEFGRKKRGDGEIDLRGGGRQNIFEGLAPMHAAFNLDWGKSKRI